MVSDSIDSAVTTSSASNSRDCANKKRANRSAKLKQWKLDARRKQWLSQAEVKKNCVRKKERSCGEESWRGNRNERDNQCGDFDSEHSDKDIKTPIRHKSDKDALDCTDSGTNFTESCCGSSGSNTANCCSGNITEEEDKEEKFAECLDDWDQHFSDALSSFGSSSPDSTLSPNSTSAGQGSPDQTKNVTDSAPQRDPIAPSVPRSASGSGGGNTVQNSSRTAQNRRGNSQSRQLNTTENPVQDSKKRAQRKKGKGCSSQPGPQSLPGRTSCTSPVSTACPICYEDMDATDASFFPCEECTFQLCLFCYRKVLQEDKRCPNCRKPYKEDAAAGAEPRFLDRRGNISSSNSFLALKR